MFGLNKFGSGIGLHRILQFCTEKNIDLEYLSSISIIVTGSKGKGSTTRFIYHALSATLKNVGCFISPHLFHVSERYEVAGNMMNEATFELYKSEVLQFADTLVSENDLLGEFELLFLIALRWFDFLRPDCVVWEAGIGGRYDPVRALHAEFSVLTSVELEHTELLGHSLELIAFDKLDATRPGGISFISPAVSETLYKRIRAFGSLSNKTLIFLKDTAFIDDINTSASSTTYIYRGSDKLAYKVQLPLIGLHQVFNSMTALAVADSFLKMRGHPFSFDALVFGLLETKWPGRLEQISQSPNIWIDVGHTPESVRTVCDEFLKIYHRDNVLLVLGVSYNKAFQEIARIVQERFTSIMLTRAYKNGLDVLTLQSAFDGYQGRIMIAQNVVDAVKQIRQLMSASEMVTFVVGGLFLAAEFAYAWRGGNPSQLEFF